MADRFARTIHRLADWPYTLDAAAWLAWLVVATVIILAWFRVDT